MLKAVGVAAVVGALLSSMAVAEPIKIGIAAEPLSLDPHYRADPADIAMLRLLYEPLTWIDKNQEAAPVISRLWTQVTPTEWQFDLRAIATWHDGTPITARDVVYSLCRVKSLGGGPDSFAPYVAGIVGAEASALRQVTIRTNAPDATLPTSLAAIAIIPAAGATGDIVMGADGCTGVAAYPTRADFDSGSVMGSGTHKVQSRTPGKQLVLARVDDYWAGMKTRWETIAFEIIPDAGARLAALLTRNVNLAHEVPTASLPGLKNDGSFSYSLLPTNGRLVHVQFNHGARSRAGDAANPFADVRVRQALSLALDRPGLVANLSVGMGQATDVLLPPGFDEGLVKWRQVDYNGPWAMSEVGPDRVGSKHLLAQAGFADGFKTTLAASARFDDVAREIVAQLKTVGIDATLVPMAQAATADLRLGDYPGLTGELSMPLKALAFRIDSKKGLGVDNWGGYANPALEAMVAKALTVADEAARRKEMRKVEALALSDAAVVPVMFVNETWGQYYGIAVDTRMTQRSIFVSHIVNCVPCHELNP